MDQSLVEGATSRPLHAAIQHCLDQVLACSRPSRVEFANFGTCLYSWCSLHNTMAGLSFRSLMPSGCPLVSASDRDLLDKWRVAIAVRWSTACCIDIWRSGTPTAEDDTRHSFGSRVEPKQQRCS